MPAKQPQITGLGDRRPRCDGRHRVGRVIDRRGWTVKRTDPQIDLAHFETGDLEAEIETEHREVLKLFGQ